MCSVYVFRRIVFDVVELVRGPRAESSFSCQTRVGHVQYRVGPKRWQKLVIVIIFSRNRRWTKASRVLSPFQHPRAAAIAGYFPRRDAHPFGFWRESPTTGHSRLPPSIYTSINNEIYCHIDEYITLDFDIGPLQRRRKRFETTEKRILIIFVRRYVQIRMSTSTMVECLPTFMFFFPRTYLSYNARWFISRTRRRVIPVPVC